MKIGQCEGRNGTFYLPIVVELCGSGVDGGGFLEAGALLLLLW